MPCILLIAKYIHNYALKYSMEERVLIIDCTSIFLSWASIEAFLVFSQESISDSFLHALFIRFKQSLSISKHNSLSNVNFHFYNHKLRLLSKAWTSHKTCIQSMNHLFITASIIGISQTILCANVKFNYSYQLLIYYFSY